MICLKIVKERGVCRENPKHETYIEKNKQIMELKEQEEIIKILEEERL
jgi:hypothetical protein